MTDLASLFAPIPRRKPAFDVRGEGMEAVQRAAERVNIENPRLAGLQIRVQRDEGPGYLEFYPPGEGMNPNPGVPTIGLRPKFFATDIPMEEMLLGDALHHLPRVDPEFSALKRSFIESLSPRQMEAARYFHARDVAERGEHRSFEDFFDQSLADAFIRAVQFEREREYIDEPFFTEENRAVVRQMKDLLKQPR